MQATFDIKQVLWEAVEQQGLMVSMAPERLSEAAVQAFAAWLAAGKHAGMDFLCNHSEVRGDVSKRFGWAKSVVVLSAPHYFDAPAAPLEGTYIGKVARYAWTPDYHQALEPVLRQLEQLLASHGVRAKGYVDYGPVLERGFAEAAGLGWTGNNTMLMSKEHGSYQTLAVLITELEPEPTTAYADFCGNCTRCVQQCPTGALEGGTLDARRCISYWTIEHRGAIPIHMWQGIGQWLFGCDICQEVCPWNQRLLRLKQQQFWRGFEPQARLAHLNIEHLFLSSKQFERLYQGTAFMRTGRTRLLRNALVVMHNSQDTSLKPWIERAVHDINPVVAQTASMVLDMR